MQPVEQAQQGAAEGGPAPIELVHDLAVGVHDAREPREVAAAPQAADIGRTRAHRAAKDRVRVEARVQYLHGHRQRAALAARTAELFRIAIDDADLAVTQARETRQQELAAQRRQGPGPRVFSNFQVDRDYARFHCLHPLP